MSHAPPPLLIGGNEAVEFPPMSIREIQAQGGRIASPFARAPSRKKTRRHSTKAAEKEEPTTGAVLVQHFLSKLRQEPGRVIGRMDDQLAAAQRTSTLLDEQLKHLKDEHGEMKEFIRDILYTLNARGYESITDSRGGLIDLNRCRGENFLDLKGRDARARQHCPGRRLQGHEHLLKAVIGSQEKLIRSLINQLNSAQRNEILGSRLSAPPASHSPEADAEKSAILEKEILGLVTSLESVLDRHPGIYAGLKEQVLLEESRGNSGRSNGILSAVLARHQLASLGEQRHLSGQSEESRSRPTRVRRKLVPYSAAGKRQASHDDLLSLATFGKAFGSLSRDRAHPRPPTPGMATPTFPELCSEEADGPFGLTRATSLKSLIGQNSLQRPVTSINEYSSRKLRRGMTRWTF